MIKEIFKGCFQGTVAFIIFITCVVLVMRWIAG